MQYDNFGKFLNNKRESFNPKLSLNSFAFEINIDSAILSRIENQKHDIELSVLVKIANAYGVKLSELIH